MSMTKKDFIALADALRELEHESWYGPGDVEVIRMNDVRDALADFCAGQNPRFNRARWLAYINGECGPSRGRKS